MSNFNFSTVLLLSCSVHKPKSALAYELACTLLQRKQSLGIFFFAEGVSHLWRSAQENHATRQLAFSWQTLAGGDHKVSLQSCISSLLARGYQFSHQDQSSNPCVGKVGITSIQTLNSWLLVAKKVIHFTP